MSNEITEYDFDGAVLTCLKMFGNSPLNKIFLAEYLGGMAVTDVERRVQVPPTNVGQRLLPNNIEGGVESKFWETFDRCYMITPAKYAEICLYYFNYYVSTGSRDRQLILVQSGVLKTALENDCKFFFPGVYDTIKRERFAEMDRKPVAVYEIVKDYLDWQSGNTIHGAAWGRLHVRPNDLQRRLMNPENELLLSVIHRAIAQQIPLAPRTPWLVVILQKGSSGKPIYDEWKELVESEVSDKSVLKKDFNSRNGKAFWIAQTIGSEATDELLNQYKILIFYANMFNWFATYVVRYIEDRRYRVANIAWRKPLPENYPETDKSTAAHFSVVTIANFNTVMRNITRFPVFTQAFSSIQVQNMRVERIEQEQRFRQARGKKVGSRFFTS